MRRTPLWKQWIANGSVAIVLQSQEADIPKDKILSAPMCYIRTNFSKETDPLTPYKRSRG